MADPSLTSNCTFTSTPLERKEKEVLMVAEESELRPRLPLKDLPRILVDSKYKDQILTLPAEERWVPFTLRQFQGFWNGESVLHGILKMQEVFKPQPSDLIVASFPKSGTLWLKALVFTAVHRDKYAFSSHPLLQLNPHDCVPFMEHQYAVGDEQYLETLPSPRVLATHTPYSMLSESIKSSKSRIIYICRDPKDVIVSWWHMETKMRRPNEQRPITQAFELFCEGLVPAGPVWEHVLEYYTKSLHSPEKILFLKYEEMMKNPSDGVKRLADFIGCPFSEEEVKRGVVEEIVEFCSFNKLKDLDVNKNNGEGNVQNNHFFRKAVVGDWQNHLTAEMAARLDEIAKEKLHGSGFTFGSPFM